MAANNKTVTGTDPVTEPTETDVETDDGGKPDASDDTASDADDQSLPLDQVFEILKNQRRRTVLRYLAEHDEPVSLGDLAEYVAADENDTPVKQISSRERKCAYVGLYQCHLPKMDNMDIIEFNQNRGLVETGQNADQLKQYMDWSDEETRPWPVYYGAAAGIGFAAVLTTGLLGSGGIALAATLPFLLGIGAIAVLQHRSEE